MVRWRNLERSGNVQDRRGMSPGRVAGGAGGLGIIGILIALLFGGGGEDGGLGSILESLAPPSTVAQTLPSDAVQDDASQFVSAILGTNETLWQDILTSAGLDYRDAQLVLFSGSTNSGCGGASSQVGPHYCSLDETIYIDLDFFAELQSRFGASGGDFAQAYVISHEFAHHMQNVLGVSGQVQNLSQQDPSQRNDLSVRLELQADCFAGVWASSIQDRQNVLEAGDIEEALSAAAAVGDDRIQESVTGRVDPESWTHGSSQQRVDWFTTGLNTGDANQCDTFSGNV
jgi:predicted metalloprotease